MKKNFSITINAGTCIGLCAVDSDAADHPNKHPFKGTLLVVDEPSNRPPNGADGHRIIVRKDVAEKKLKSLIGMGINYTPAKLNAHNPKHKVGVITGAKIVGKEVQVWGNIFAKDFPEAKTELRRPGMGMSMELADVMVKDKNAPVWDLTDFHFTGATALYKHTAAYQKTSLSAEALKESLQQPLSEVIQFMKGEAMKKNKEKDRKHKTKTLSGSSEVLGNLVTSIGESVKQAVTEGMKGFGKQLEAINASVQDQGKALLELSASRVNDSSEKDSVAAEAESNIDSGDELSAAMYGKKGEASSSSSSVDAAKDKDESSSDGDDSSMSDSDDVEAELAKIGKSAKGNKAPASTGEESADPEFGHLNDGAKNKGRKQEVSAGVSTVINIAARAEKKIKSIRAENAKLRTALRENKRATKDLEAQVEDMQAQISDFTNSQVPKSLTPDVRMLLQKGGHDIGEVMASGRKFTVGEVDTMINAMGLSLQPVERMTMKNKLLSAGLMEQGEMASVYQQ